MQYDRLTLAVFEKGLLDRNSPICTLSQTGYGDQRAKARKYTCLLALNKNAALHVHGAKRRSFVFTGGAGERWSSGMQDATVPNTVWPSATEMGTSPYLLSGEKFKYNIY
jgi:hypothetical protein